MREMEEHVHEELLRMGFASGINSPSIQKNLRKSKDKKVSYLRWLEEMTVTLSEYDAGRKRYRLVDYAVEFYDA